MRRPGLGFAYPQEDNHAWCTSPTRSLRNHYFDSLGLPRLHVSAQV